MIPRPSSLPSRDELSPLRARKYADARRALFDAAMQLFREKGFDETTVDDIAARAGFSRATFFNHFGAKPAVLRVYGERLVDRMERILSETGAEISPLERLRRVLLGMAREVEEHREDWRIVYTFSLRDPDYLACPTPARLRFLEGMTGLISEAQRLGEARRDVTAKEQAEQVMALYQFAVMTVIVHRRTAKAAIDAAWRFAMGGIRGGDPVASRRRQGR